MLLNPFLFVFELAAGKTSAGHGHQCVKCKLDPEQKNDPCDRNIAIPESDKKVQTNADGQLGKYEEN